MTIKAATDPALRAGYYATKQLFSDDPLVAWSHRRRFEVGLALARRFAGCRVLDYGCGDGTFLALLQAGDARPTHAVGAELDPWQVSDCRARFGAREGLSFELIDSLDDDGYAARFDGVVCMEVLEHVVALDEVLERLWRLLADAGILLVSVPVETGLPLLVKQAARRVAAWRGIGDYPGTSAYTFTEYAASVFAGRRQHFERPIYGADGPRPFHDHKGFNWKVLGDRLRVRFDIEQTLASPIPWLGPRLATQVWFVGRKRHMAR